MPLHQDMEEMPIIEEPMPEYPDMEKPVMIEEPMPEYPDMEEMPMIEDEPMPVSEDISESEDSEDYNSDDEETPYGRNLKGKFFKEATSNMLESNYTRAELEKMLDEYKQKVAFFKADIADAKAQHNKTRLYQDWKQIKIYFAKVQWVKKQLINPTPPTPKPDYTHDQLERMLAKFTQKLDYFNADMVKAKSEGKKIRYYRDRK